MHGAPNPRQQRGTRQKAAPIGETSWTIIERAARGDAEARDRFASIYAPALQAYFAKRWRGSPYSASVEDAVQEVFVDCFKPGGVLDRADRVRDGGFRAFFYGVARTTAMRCEAVHRKQAARGTASAFDPDRVLADDASLSKAFDRAWAQSIVREAVLVYRERARTFGGREEFRAEILRLRFEAGQPIREICKQLDLTPELAHQEYTMARRGFQKVLEDVVSAHYSTDSTDLRERCREVVRLLG